MIRRAGSRRRVPGAGRSATKWPTSKSVANFLRPLVLFQAPTVPSLPSQNAPAQGSIRSKIITLQYHLEMCLEVFNLGAGDIIQAVNATNVHYGGRRPQGSNVFFSDFSDDPWQTASVDEVGRGVGRSLVD